MSCRTGAHATVGRSSSAAPRAPMDLALWWAWTEAVRGAVTGALVYSSAAGVTCPPCTCQCSPRVTCPGGHSAEVSVLGLSVAGALALACFSALLGAGAALIAVQRGWALGSGGDVCARAAELSADVVPSLELISLQQAREIRARRTALR